MLAFHNDAQIKAKYLKRVRIHRKLDQIVKGQYWEGGKGCAVGCTLHSANHADYEKELGIPVQLAYLEDGIFENLPNDLAMAWPERFLKAAKPGADLSHVQNHFLIWLLIDGVAGVIRFAQTERECKAIQDVAGLHAQVIAGDPPTAAAWAVARAAAAWAADAADAAADAAARTAVYAVYAVYAVWAAARAAAWAADATAWAAARAAAWAADATAWDAARDAARDAAYIHFSDKLIELMEAA